MVREHGRMLFKPHGSYMVFDVKAYANVNANVMTMQQLFLYIHTGEQQIEQYFKQLTNSATNIQGE